MTDSFRGILQTLVDQHSAEVLQRQAVERVLRACGHTDPPDQEVVEVDGQRTRRYTWDTGELAGEIVLLDGQVEPAPEAPAPYVPDHPLDDLDEDDDPWHGEKPPLLVRRYVNKYNAEAFWAAIAEAREAFAWAEGDGPPP